MKPVEFKVVITMNSK